MACRSRVCSASLLIWVTARVLASPQDDVGENGKRLHPILFMGGLGASMLHADLNRTSVAHWYCSKQESDYPLWLYYRNFVPFREECWMDNMKLAWSSDGTLQDVGVHIKLVGDHLPAGSDISAGYPKDLWGDLLSGVADLGYSGTSSRVGALHYDWRLGPLEFARDGTYAKFKRSIEQYVSSSENKRAVLVTLSYAGPILHEFLANYVDQAWKGKYVERWISLSGTFGGSAELTRISFYPLDHDFYDLPKFLPYMSLPSARDMSNTFASTFVSRPNYQESNESLLTVTRPQDNSVRRYTKDDISQALTDSDLHKARELFEIEKDAYIFDQLDPPGVAVDCIYGVADDTISSLVFGKGFNTPATSYGYEDGDGVAPTRSLKRCAEWGKEVSVHALPHIGHGGPLHKPEAVKTFSKIIHSLYAVTPPRIHSADDRSIVV